jgi:hypothetical protein
MFEPTPRPGMASPLEALAHPGGPMDRGDDHDESKRFPALLPFFARFVLHDITCDLTSALEQSKDPSGTENFRTPAVALDSVYGLGPWASPYLYDQRSTHAAMLLLGQPSDVAAEVDLPRNSQGVALIAEPRNDLDPVIAQLHAVFLKFHNAVVAQLGRLSDGVEDDGGPFVRAKRLTSWHYQWLVLRHLLEPIVGTEVVEEIRKEGRKLYLPPGIPFIPIEFSHAVCWFADAMLHPHYDINDQFDAKLTDRELTLLGTDDRAMAEPQRATWLAPRIDWRNFLAGGVLKCASATNRFSSRIQPRLASPLLRTSEPGLRSSSPGSQSVVARNLHDALALELPCGQEVAGRVRERLPATRPLDANALWAGTPFRDEPAPLWYYVLQEANIQHGGERLGDVGGRIFAEVIIGLLELDSASFFARKKDWTPLVEGREHADDFTFVDLFRIAGVDFG